MRKHSERTCEHEIKGGRVGEEDHTCGIQIEHGVVIVGTNWISILNAETAVVGIKVLIASEPQNCSASEDELIQAIDHQSGEKVLIGERDAISDSVWEFDLRIVHSDSTISIEDNNKSPFDEGTNLMKISNE